MVKLRDVGKIITGNTPKTSEKENYESNDICFVKPSDIEDDSISYIEETENFIAESAREKARILPVNSVLVTCIGIIGKIGINKIECAFNQQINAIVPNKEICLAQYLAYAIKSKKFLLQDTANAPVVPILNKTQFADVEIKIVDLKEQESIVHRLAKVEALIDQRKQQLQKLDELVKARFVEMFGDVKTNDKKWSDGILSEYFFVKGGKRIPKGMGYSNHVTTHPYLRTTDMKNSTIIDDDIHYIDEEVFQKIKRYTVNAGDIYLTNVGVNLGMAGTIPEKYDGANLTENAVKLIPKSNNFNGDFLAFYINSSGVQDYISERKMTVGVPKLAIFRIETMPLVIPPIEIQNKFADFVQQINKSKLYVQKSLDKLEMLKKSLMQKYFG